MQFGSLDKSKHKGFCWLHFIDILAGMGLFGYYFDSAGRVPLLQVLSCKGSIELAIELITPRLQGVHVL